MAEPIRIGIIICDRYRACAGGKCLRALRNHLEGISDDDIVGLEIPTGIPYRYVFDDELGVLSHGFLGDTAAAEAAAEAVRRQAG